MNERPNIEQIKAELAADLVRIIGERKLSDADACARLGVSEQDLACLRDGKTEWTSIDELVGFLNVLDKHVGVTVDDAAHNPLLSLLKYVEEVSATIPPEELDRLPTDMAANIDHYLYGSPKRD